MEPERNYLNPHNIDPSRIEPCRRFVADVKAGRKFGFDSVRPGQERTDHLSLCGCGGKAQLYWVDAPYVEKGWHIECLSCLMRLDGSGLSWGEKQIAIDIWNAAFRRA